MKANLSLYNAIFNIWMCAIHPSRQIRVTSVDWWTFDCQLFSCLALKTMPFCCEIIVTLFPSSEVHASIRCIKGDVALTFINNCRRKTGFLRLFRGGYFSESGIKLWPILPDARNMNYSFHRKCGQRQDLQFNLICRLSRKPISVASTSLFFICTDCQRDYVRTSSSPYLSNESNLQLRGTTRKKQLWFWPFILRANSHSWVEIYRLNHNKFVFKCRMFPNETLLHSFSVENAIFLGTNLKWASSKTEAIPWTQNAPVERTRQRSLHVVSIFSNKFPIE